MVDETSSRQGSSNSLIGLCIYTELPLQVLYTSCICLLPACLLHLPLLLLLLLDMQQLAILQLGVDGAGQCDLCVIERGLTATAGIAAALLLLLLLVMVVMVIA
jgi:hypothetical protein